MASPYRTTTLKVDSTAFVAPSALLIGEVSVDRAASIWFNATLRGDLDAIVIGAETNIQDGCIVHVDPGLPTRIGQRVTVGHGAVVHGSQVGDDVLIGIKAVVLSGCEIGRHSLIGAGAVVREGTQVPPGSLVLGIPAQVVRQLRPEEVTRIEANARTYVALAQAYREGRLQLPSGRA